MKQPTARRLLERFLRIRLGALPRLARRGWSRSVRTVDHEAIVAGVDGDGSLRSSFLFMSVMSAGIAIVGLLVNSPAVIIGAMLISPLMAPILRLGLGIGMLDHVRVRNAIGVLAAGMSFALLTSMAIAAVSPIHELTPELLSRTRPTLFDLLVAVLSGLAGGYALVRRREGAIVGVAIATALMPPLAVIGFGLATGQAGVASGAFLLFITNFVAIALSVTSVVTWYGFSQQRVRHALVWQMALMLLLGLPLAIPLLQSLRSIANETRVAGAVRGAVLATLGADTSRVLNLQVVDGAPIRIELTLAARHYDADDDLALRTRIAESVGKPVEVRLSPIIEADPSRAPLPSPWPLAPRVSPVPVVVGPAPGSIEAVLDAFPIPLEAHSIDREARTATIYPAAGLLRLHDHRAMEVELATQHAGWRIRVVPPVQALPPVRFERGSDVIQADQDSVVDLLVWTLSRWNVGTVRVEAFASNEGVGNRALAGRRAEAVAERLRAAGIAAEASASERGPEQIREERSLGRNAFQVARVTPAGAVEDPVAPPSGEAP